MDSKRIMINPQAKGKYPLYLKLSENIIPSRVIASHPIAFADFELLDQGEVESMFGTMHRIIELQSGR